MINKQKLWFLTLFSLILVLSVYYITMPSEVLTTMKSSNIKKTTNKVKVSTKNEDALTVLRLDTDEERSKEIAEYNEVLTNKNATTEEKNNAYDGIKQIDEVKAKEADLEKKLKDKLKLKSFIKIDGDNISVTIKKDNHDYALANSIMRLMQEEFKDKKYISVKFQK